MPTTTFLSNEILWQTLLARVKSARHVDAAIAYMGQGGAKLLPLKKGDRLVVDLSAGTVRAGATDPREVEKLIRRGVSVFTRRNLHAKVVIADNSLISGSANVSRNSQLVLDEAGIFTNDPLAIRRAKSFFERLCTEPVRREYLAECKCIYRPPRLNGRRDAKGTATKRVTHAKLWIVYMTVREPSEFIRSLEEQGEETARTMIKDSGRSEIQNFNHRGTGRITKSLEMGDWIVSVSKYEDGSIRVSPPTQFLYKVGGVDPLGKQYTVFYSEGPKRGSELSWNQFKRAAKPFLGSRHLLRPKTMPIPKIEIADRLLGIWTAGGRISKR